MPEKDDTQLLPKALLKAQKESQAPVDTMGEVSQNHDSSEPSQQKETASSDAESSLLHEFDVKSTTNNQISMKSRNSTIFAVLTIVAILAGVGTGYGGFKLQTRAGGSTPLSSGGGEIQQIAEEGRVKVGDVFGVDDANTFKDSAEGYLEIGGLDGEGSHKLLRPGGESQTVYLTSSITDLDTFDGMEVKVSGETFKGQKAGWLMDVGRIEVTKLDGKAPEAE